jgi:hypothetical protein
MHSRGQSDRSIKAVFKSIVILSEAKDLRLPFTTHRLLAAPAKHPAALTDSHSPKGIQINEPAASIRLSPTARVPPRPVE